MTIDLQVALWGIGVIFLGGGMYADIRTRLGRMEKMLGNGTPGMFVRRDEMKFRVDKAEEEHHEFRRRIEDLEAGR